MDDDTGMDTENALTAVEPKETRCGSAPLATSSAREEVGARKTAERLSRNNWCIQVEHDKIEFGILLCRRGRVLL